MTRIGFRAATVAALMALTAVTPVSARGGSVSLTINPKGQDAQVVREGFFLYSLFKHSKSRGSGARIDQRGTGNGAAIAQHGNGNTAEVIQRGRNQQAMVTQNGANNWLGLLQFGRNTRSTVSQNGNGQTGLVIEGGW